jgi:hypothetical protein
MAPPKKRPDGEKGEKAVADDDGRAWEAGAPAAFMDFR